MNTYQLIDKRMNYLLKLKRKLVGIFFFETKEAYEQSHFPAYQRLIPYCKAVQRASVGDSFKLTLKNFACPASAVALGLIANNEYSASGQKHADMKVYCTIDVSKKIADDMVYCKKRSYGIGIAPIEDWRQAPDSVLIITTPYNGMRLIQGHAYYSGQLKNIKMAGMQAICQEGTSYPLEKKTINLSMMCSGTRHVAQWGEEELCVGIPYPLLEKVISGMEETLNPMELLNGKKAILERMAKTMTPIFMMSEKKRTILEALTKG